MKKKNTTAARAVTSPAGALPVRKVVLYKHGIGYFERIGAVNGDESIVLHFKAAEMNDVLKSLTALDLGDGLIASISYESTLPIAKQLDDISIRLTDNNSLTDLLAQAKGARVAVNLGGKKVEGTILGIESVTRKDGDVALTSNRLALLVNGDSLQSYDLLDVSSTVFLDDSVRKDLQHLLDTLITAKKKDRKKLTVFAKGKGRREILVGYAVETPVWKTSYRVLLGEAKPLLQGWAIVDNTQDDDWEDVSLTLVAGLPVSFIHDLYSPRYKRRPTIHVQEEEAYAPPVLEEVEDPFSSKMEPDMEMSLSQVSRPAPAAAGLMRKSKAVSTRSRQADIEGSTNVQTRTVEVGDLFHYEIENPITVKRGQSALVPILQTKFDGKRVAVYNADVREKNPMSAILFKNVTGMTLEGGPMTVLEDENYVGESMLETMKPDEERLVPYSVELGCVISSDHTNKRLPYYFSRIAHGTLHLYRYVLDTRTYVVNNKGDKKLDLFIEHRFNQGWELVETPAPVERTANFYRFRIDVPPKQTVKFSVRERGDAGESFSIQNVDRDTVRAWVESRFIDAEVAERLQGIAKLNETAGTLERQIAAIEEDIQTIFKDQERLRKNMQSLGNAENERTLRERYVSELSAEEDKLRNYREQVRRHKQEKTKVEKELRAMVDTLAFEHQL